ncbi:hypothetical protein GAYE_SCF51G6101 [Galdieria yellowstonensis]|uniref:Beta-mannosidase-like galactose-binding domain-containing protein n=1 Tax=Galdieria yellowstonensis TaxID=3028027 RepID=A0AAV9ILL6_9RHOD|nr:hypothetical protein GAYE_SCF51G6101 [Galdieria yellowstonensis]
MERSWVVLRTCLIDKSLKLTGSHDIELKVVVPPKVEYVKNREETLAYREWDDSVSGGSRFRKAKYSFGWNWGRRLLSCGIMGNAYIVCIPRCGIGDFRISQQHESLERVVLDVNARVELVSECKVDARLDVCNDNF